MGQLNQQSDLSRITDTEDLTDGSLSIVPSQLRQMSQQVHKPVEETFIEPIVQPPIIQKTFKIKTWDSLISFTKVPYPIHGFIILRKFDELKEILSVCDPQLIKDHIDEKDNKGNTPIILACKLCEFDIFFIEFVHLLFHYNANPKLKDCLGWRILDEAIFQQNSRLLVLIFDFMNQRKKFKWERDKAKTIARLKKIPDFYLKMHWECQSDWIPFLSKIAPSDDLEIWKVGASIRLDFSLVGFNKLINKRRPMTMLIVESS